MGIRDKVTRNKVGAFLGGVLAVMAAFYFGRIVSETVSMVNFRGYETPFTLAFTALGTGHYFGKSISDDNSDRMVFYFGAFSAISVQLLGSSGVGPKTGLLVCAAGCASLIHVTDLIHDDDFEYLMEAVAGKASRYGLIVITVTKYGASLSLSLFGGLPTIGLEDKVILAAVVVLIAYIYLDSEPETIVGSKEPSVED